jgi:hypothetical protein
MAKSAQPITSSWEQSELAKVRTENARLRETNTRLSERQTPVDYDAWNRGYMPPSEHVLIDKLAYRGARVVLSTPLGRDRQMWVVLEGPSLTNKERKHLREMVNLMFEDEDEPAQESEASTNDV